MSEAIAGIAVHSEGSLLGVIDRLLDHGVMIQGDLEVSVAGVDLLSVGLKVFLASIDKADLWRRGIDVADEILIVLVAAALPAAEVRLSGRDFLVRRRDGQIADAALIARVQRLAEHHGGGLDPLEGRQLGGELRIVVRLKQEHRSAFLAALARELPELRVSISGASSGAGC
jgi:hypothetical protein